MNRGLTHIFHDLLQERPFVLIIVIFINQIEKHIPQIANEGGAFLNPIDKYQGTPNKLQQSQDDSGNLNKTYNSCPVLFVEQIEQMVILFRILLEIVSPT